MATLNSVPDTFALSGDYESRVAQLLRIAQHEARVTQSVAAPRMQDVLSDLEDTHSDQLAALDNAAEDDKAMPRRRGRPRGNAGPGAR
jgi:hypothetical protein